VSRAPSPAGVISASRDAVTVLSASLGTAISKPLRRCSRAATRTCDAVIVKRVSENVPPRRIAVDLGDLDRLGALDGHTHPSEVTSTPGNAPVTPSYSSIRHDVESSSATHHT